jgi:hypothetical protein
VSHLQVQLAERVSHDANVVRFYGAAVAPHAVLLVMELMQVGRSRLLSQLSRVQAASLVLVSSGLQPV